MDPAGPRPTLAVVVPTWNEELALPELLARILPGSNRANGADLADLADEVVVADGGSRDRTVDVARDAGARVVVGPRGRGSQLARGARDCASEVLLFLHADCVPEPGSLAALRGAYRDERVVWSAMPQRVAARGLFFRLVERASDRRARRGCVYGDSGLAVRRGAYAASGGFADLPIFEDVEFSRRLRRLGPVHWVEGARLRVSPRRWEREGRLRCTLRNRLLRMAYECGVSPKRLAGRYAPHGPVPPAPSA